MRCRAEMEQGCHAMEMTRLPLPILDMCWGRQLLSDRICLILCQKSTLAQSSKLGPECNLIA
jgi:hypothetical protein